MKEIQAKERVMERQTLTDGERSGSGDTVI